MTISVQVTQRSKLSVQVIIQTPNESAKKTKTLKTGRSYGISGGRNLSVRRKEPLTTNIYSFDNSLIFKEIKSLREKMHAERIRRVVT
jgi:hypothetical protein